MPGDGLVFRRVFDRPLRATPHAFSVSQQDDVAIVVGGYRIAEQVLPIAQEDLRRNARSSLGRRKRPGAWFNPVRRGCLDHLDRLRRRTRPGFGSRCLGLTPTVSQSETSHCNVGENTPGLDEETMHPPYDGNQVAFSKLRFIECRTAQALHRSFAQEPRPRPAAPANSRWDHNPALARPGSQDPGGRARASRIAPPFREVTSQPSLEAQRGDSHMQRTRVRPAAASVPQPWRRS